jgi:hypothetical protein
MKNSFVKAAGVCSIVFVAIFIFDTHLPGVLPGIP